MKIAGYIHPGILGQGPLFNQIWFAIVLRLLDSLRRAGNECVLIAGSRFPRALESEVACTLQGIRLVELDEIELFRQMSTLGVMPTMFNKLAYEARGLEHHPVLRFMAEKVVSHCADFEPDVLISFAIQTDFLASIWPNTMRLHIEAGAYSHNPFPVSLFFDHMGMYGRSVVAGAGRRLRDLPGTPGGRELAARFREHNLVALQTVDPFRSLDLHARFDRLCLLPLQVSNWYSFDEQAPYRTQFEFLLDVLAAAPADVGIVITEHVQWGQVLKYRGGDRNIDYLRKVFPNMIFYDQFRSFASASQFLVPRVDGVWSVSSNVGYQALLFDRALGTPPISHLAGIAHSHGFADFFAKLGSERPQSREGFISWQLENYLVPEALWSDSDWLDDYLRRRLKATASTEDPIEALVPLASVARLEEAWIHQAPDPIARPLSPVEMMDGVLVELDDARKAYEATLKAYEEILQSSSWRLTAPLRAAKHFVGTAIRGRSAKNVSANNMPLTGVMCRPPRSVGPLKRLNARGIAPPHAGRGHGE